MRFKIDENLPAESAALLKGAGHVALSDRDDQRAYAPDVLG